MGPFPFREPMSQKAAGLCLVIQFQLYCLLLEVSVVESLETCSVTRFVLAHLVDCVVDSVKVLLLCKSGDSLLVLACAMHIS